MTTILRRFMPIPTPKINDDDHDEDSLEYSFAIEYNGPPVSYHIPHVVPVDVQRIPTAAVVSSPSLLNNLSLPVIEPIVMSGKKPAKGSKAAESVVSGRVSAEFEGSGHDFVDVNKDQEEEGDGLENGDGCEPRVPDGTGNSGTLGFSDRPNESNEVFGSSDIEDSKDESGMEMEDRNLRACAASSEISEEMENCGHQTSLEISICEEGGNYADEISEHGTRTSVVTFREPLSSDGSTENGYLDEPDNVVRRPVARSDLGKAVCHHCFKRNRFTEKEVCIVCGAKYCSGCVIRAMGSMQEGRKCVTCIGYPIDESKRVCLGKSSKILKRLLTDWEVKVIMRQEVSCEANQVPPNLVYINGRPLSLQELVLLQTCRNPPKKLRPGRYWYDRESGFWGKEGHPPCQIIRPLLDVGGPISRNASNGNTKVVINGREITKKELWMLQMAGVNCEGQPYFWLSADGAYQEEGQNNIMGKLWDKSSMKFVCAALSLPIPPDSCDEEVEEAKGSSDNLDEKVLLHKLLLLGCDQSGTSTIFKQAKIVYKVPFSEDERQSIKLLIQTNLYRYIGILLEGRERFEVECLNEVRRQHLSQPGPSAYAEQIVERNAYSMSARLKSFSDWLLQVMMAGNLETIFPAATRECAPLVEELLKDNGFQAAYNRRKELDVLPQVANYFLDRAVEISSENYEPSDMDILYAEGITSSNGVVCTEFSFPMSSQDVYMEPIDQTEPCIRYSNRFELIRAHASSLGENCKWLEMFEDVDMVIFCVSLTDYDEYFVNGNGVCMNKMLASKKLIENVVTHRTFAEKDLVLMLNKFDLLEEKLKRVPLSECEWFEDFKPVMSYHPHRSSSGHNPSLAQRAFHYIAVKFKRMLGSLTERKLYVARVAGLETGSVDEALKYCREILKWEEERPRVCRNEFSSESIEASTSS